MKLFNRKKTDEFTHLQEEIKDSSFDNIRGLLDGSMLSHKKFVEQLPFLFFLTFLGLFYIGLNYEHEKTFKRQVKTQKEVSELRYKSIEYRIKLMEMNRVSEIERRVKDAKLGLKPLSGPVTKIKISD